MENLKIQSIKKGLKCLAGEKPCNLCFYHETAEHQETNCVNLVVSDALKLIDELENDLKIANMNLEHLISDGNYSCKKNCLNKVIERLKNSFKQKVNSENVDVFVQVINITTETLTEIFNESN